MSATTPITSSNGPTATTFVGTKPTGTRIYAVANKGQLSLVRAPNRAQAIARVVQADIECEVATQEQLVAHITAGGQILDVKDPQAQLELEPGTDTERRTGADRRGELGGQAGITVIEMLPALAMLSALVVGAARMLG